MAPVAVVTGTSSGIGMWTAVELAAGGAQVVATMRDPDRAGSLREAARDNGVELDVRALDVTDPDACRSCVGALIADFGAIDVLVNNAGQGHVGTLEQISDETLQRQLDVNYLAVARLTRLVLPGMRERGSGRIVTVTSVGGVVGQPFADAYCGAKFAVEGLMQSLAPVAARFGVGVSVVEPAAVASAFVGNNTGIDDADDVDPYAGLRAAYLATAGASFSAAQDSRDAARTVAEAALTDRPKFRWQTSSRAAGFAGLSLADLDGSAVLAQTATWIA